MVLQSGKYFADTLHRTLTITVAPVLAVPGGFRVYVHTGFDTVLVGKCWSVAEVQIVAEGYDDLEEVLFNAMCGEPVLRPYRRGGRYDRRPRCNRCHRALTSPESVAAGIGPECAAQEGIAA